MDDHVPVPRNVYFNRCSRPECDKETIQFVNPLGDYAYAVWH